MQIKVNSLIRIVLFLCGVITSVIVFLNNNSVPYTLFLIPLIYGILIAFFPSITKYIFGYLGVLALNICMFIRYVLSPFFTTIDGTNVATNMLANVNNYSIAVNLMLYEMVLIFIFFSLFNRYFYSSKNTPNIEISYNVTGWMYLLFCFGLIMIYPELLNRYTFVFTADQLESKDMGIEVLSIVPLLLQLGSLVVIISFINVFYKKYQKTNSSLYLFYSLLIVIFISSFIVGTSRFSTILPLISGLFIVYVLYKNHRKIVSTLSTIAITLFLIISTLLKDRTFASEASTVTDILGDLNMNLQLYFSGITNVAIAVQTSDFYPSFKIDSIMNDIFRSVVLINSFFDSDISALEMFNVVFYNGGLARDQILPMIGQGYLYFGFILAPIFSLIILLIMMVLDKKSKNEKNIFLKYIYIFATLRIGLFMMVNFTNLLAFLTNQVFILLLIFFINSLIVNKGRMRK
ncbi:O-antigen polymerase [Salinicoccus kekensis]|uniref:Oligosaccharide repeat unit polymerase n=1 Tax=Salinicoccus kekensis TaxID=714307 RepID=A0A285UTM3_9STAP|nr:O-antigen polymerase [Salinicoccus kekensis]SOC44728.1 hypothetical protein SAMN05878391_2450 [Salinicoccus kekensis]